MRGADPEVLDALSARFDIPLRSMSAQSSVRLTGSIAADCKID
jgi:hypothetical protein